MNEKVGTWRWRQAALLVVVFIVLTGCGKDARVSVVRGVVTLEGEPVPDASVTFMPEAGGRPAFGVTSADGTYTLTTFQQGDGALLGNHRVTVMAVEETSSSKAEALAEEHGSLAELMQPGKMSKQVWRIPPRYADESTSGLQFDVLPSTTNQADFSLTTKP